MRIQPILVPFANDVARWGAARGPAAMLRAGMEDALRAAGHSVAEPVTASLARDRRTRDPVTNLGIIAAWVSDQVAAAIAHADKESLQRLSETLLKRRGRGHPVEDACA